MTDQQQTITEPAAPPTIRLHPLRWIRENLFSTWWNALLTIVVFVGILGFFWGIVRFAVAPERQWESIWNNTRLYATLAYPEAAYTRVWVSLGIVVALTALSLAAWLGSPRIPVARLTRSGAIAGGAIAAASLVLWLVPEVSPLIKTLGVVVGVVLVLVSLGLRQAFGAEAYQERLPLMGVIAVVIAIVLAAMWLAPVLIGDIQIAATTRVPLTVMAGLGVVVYLVGLRIRAAVTLTSFQAALVGLWLLSLPLIYLVVLRAPALDWALIRRQDLPIYLAYLIGGSLILWVISNPERTPLARFTAAVILMAAIAVWLPPLSSVVPLIKIRVPLFLLALFVLAAPSFGGTAKARLRIVIAWAVLVTLSSYFLAVGQAGSTLVVQTAFIGGLMLTMLLAILGIIIAFPLGVALALGRTSTMPIFRLVSTIYIEVIRGVPLITLLFFGALFLPLFFPSDIRIDSIVRALIAISLFGAAYLAENVRGGLQAIPQGQYEAARAVGLTTIQLTFFITLPQALRAVIPALVGQTIALFKDTSLVFIIGLTEILAVAQRVVPGQPDFVGSQRENLLFVALVYWLFTFSFSRASQRLERKLGVGER